MKNIFIVALLLIIAGLLLDKFVLIHCPCEDCRSESCPCDDCENEDCFRHF